MAAEGSVVIEVTADDSGAQSKLKSLGRVAGSMLKGMAAAAGVAGAAVIGLGKKAITAYADYEQLVGGVETLFKDSAGIVGEYAANAYKTAGVSANTYMETVTSFSASLLQSLGGNTEKAAKVSDMAITDMSDNANKMGTSMDAIQVAYQGFAKQNYTMLDNLKLGYGGTKSEMERLLADAEKFSGVKYDINSLNDVYQAIHVVQGELDITGTTALEASTTIQGSAASMGAAWDNLLVGLADNNQDFDQLLNNFIDSVGVFGENLLPRIEIALGGIADLAGKLVPKIAAMLPKLAADLLPKITEIAVSIIQNLLDGLTNNLPMLATAAVGILTTLVNGILTILPQLAATAVQLLTALANGIASALPTLIPAAVSALMALVQGLVDNIPALVSAALQLVQGLAQGILKAIPVLIEALPELITNLVNALLEYIPQCIDMWISLITSLVDALPDIITAIVEVLPLIIDGIITALLENLPLIVQAGIDLLVALIQALPTIITTIVTALPKIINSIIDALIENLPLLVQAGVDLFVSLIENLPTIILEIVKAVPQIIDGLVQGFLSLGGKIIDVGKNIVSGVWDGIVGMATWIKDKVTGFFSGIVDGVKNFLGIHSPSRVFADIGGNTIAGYAEGVDKGASTNQGRIMSAVEGLSSGMADSLGAGGEDSGAALMDKLAQAATGGLQGMTQVAARFVEMFNNTVSSKLDEVKQASAEVVTTLCDMVTAKQPDIVQAATITVASFCQTILAKYDEFYLAGINAMRGLNEGLRVQGQQAIATARSIATAIIAEMQRALDIHSPSRKIRDLVGKPAAQGFVVGFEGEMADFGRQMQATVDRETGKITANVAAQADGKAAADGVTREIRTNNRTVEKVARVEGDGVTGELVRMLGLKIKAEDRRRGVSLA